MRLLSLRGELWQSRTLPFSSWFLRVLPLLWLWDIRIGSLPVSCIGCSWLNTRWLLASFGACLDSFSSLCKCRGESERNILRHLCSRICVWRLGCSGGMILVLTVPKIKQCESVWLVVIVKFWQFCHSDFTLRYWFLKYRISLHPLYHPIFSSFAFLLENISTFIPLLYKLFGLLRLRMLNLTLLPLKVLETLKKYPTLGLQLSYLHWVCPLVLMSFWSTRLYSATALLALSVSGTLTAKLKFPLSNRDSNTSVSSFGDLGT